MDFYLTPRQQSILLAIVQDYILTGEPVGSRTISKKYSLGLSPATIRNDMSELEEQGLLKQPHSSAGRIPSELGYRNFVDFLMEKPSLSRDEIETIKNINTNVSRLDNILDQSGRVLSAIMNSVAIIQFPEISQDYVKHFQLLPISNHNFVILIVSNTGKVSDYLIQMDSPVEEDFFSTVTQYFNDQIIGTPMPNLQKKLNELLESNLKYDNSLRDICRSVLQSINTKQNSKIRVTGTSNLLRSPEFNETDKVHSLLNLFENDGLSEQLSSVFDNLQKSEPVILIGKEIKISQLEDCSLIVATYNAGGSAQGTIGLLGPTRMQYGKSIAVMEEMTKYLNEVLSKIYGKD